MSRTKTRGSGNAQAKLNEAKVCVIRTYYKLGREYPGFEKLTMLNLAELYAVSKTQIWRIIHKKDWAWLK